MDRDEAIRLLKGGPDGIREWNRRRELDEEIPNLGMADLRMADLRMADLRMADLRMADLRMADLRMADLRMADLRMADLRMANLRMANLRMADLSGALLIEAVLINAVCSSTIFGNVYLSEVEGLESVDHLGPSTVGVDTLVISRGKIPEAFLRGCGVPDTLIQYLPSIIGGMQPIQFYSCFISYSTKDQDFAERLHSKLRDKGLRVWFAPEDIQGGKIIHEQIDEAIRLYDKLLLVLSARSMKSDWVRLEIDKALRAEAREKRGKLFPIRLVGLDTVKKWECIDPDSGKDLGKVIRGFHIPDFSNWKDHDSFEKAFGRLIKDLKATTSTDEKTA